MDLIGLCERVLKHRVIHKSLRDFLPLRYISRDGHAEGKHVNRGRDTPIFCPTLQVLDFSTLGDGADVNSVIKFLPHTLHVCGRNLIKGLTSAASPRLEHSSTCKLGQKIGVSLPLLTCSLSAWPFRLLYCRGRKSRMDLQNYPVHPLETAKTATTRKNSEKYDRKQYLNLYLLSQCIPLSSLPMFLYWLLELYMVRFVSFLFHTYHDLLSSSFSISQTSPRSFEVIIWMLLGVLNVWVLLMTLVLLGMLFVWVLLGT